MQVTIQALSGAGTVKLPGAKTARVETGKVLVLAPNMAHTVVADEKTDLVCSFITSKAAVPVVAGGRDEALCTGWCSLRACFWGVAWSLASAKRVHTIQPLSTRLTADATRIAANRSWAK